MITLYAPIPVTPQKSGYSSYYDSQEMRLSGPLLRLPLVPTKFPALTRYLAGKVIARLQSQVNVRRGKAFDRAQKAASLSARIRKMHASPSLRHMLAQDGVFDTPPAYVYGHGNPRKRCLHDQYSRMTSCHTCARRAARKARLQAEENRKFRAEQDARIKAEHDRMAPARTLAANAGQWYDEHGGYSRGDYHNSSIVSWVPPAESVHAPFLDMGGEGLALVEVSRKRVYAKSSKWYPRTTSTSYLVGRNEAGTYFAHPVPNTVSSVRSAIAWMWSDKQDAILVRQGDIALAKGVNNGKWQKNLPWGHRVNPEGTHIVHATHLPIPVPGKGQTILVARRAVARVSEATRD